MGTNKRVIITALMANLLIAVSKTAGAILSGSASLKAEAVHSFVDTGNQILLFIGQRKAGKPPGKRHPLGHGREVFFWSFIVALLLFSLGGLYTIFEGIQKLSEHEFSHPMLGLAILVVSAFSESISLRTVLKRIASKKDIWSLYQWFKRATASELLVVFTEDSAALAGITVAVLGIVLSWITHNPIWDAIGSIGVGLILVTVAVALAIEIKSLIIGEAPAKNYEPELKQLVSSFIPGGEIKKLVAVQVGAEDVIMSYKVTRGKLSSAEELVRRLGELEQSVRERFPEVKWQFIFPVTS